MFVNCKLVASQKNGLLIIAHNLVLFLVHNVRLYRKDIENENNSMDYSTLGPA